MNRKENCENFESLSVNRDVLEIDEIEEKTFEENSDNVEFPTSVAIRLPEGWSSANVYVYVNNECGCEAIEIAPWPGVPMYYNGKIYTYTLPK